MGIYRIRGTSLALVVALMMLDPRPERLSHKAFVVVWNAANLVRLRDNPNRTTWDEG
jgi:hypothetical protein